MKLSDIGSESGQIKEIANKLFKDLPVSWIPTTLGEVFKWGSGGTPKSTNPSFYNGDIPWLIIGDLDDRVVTDSATKITEAGLKNSSAKMVEKGAILLAMYGSIGKLGIAGRQLTTNQAIAFTNAGEVETLFLFYFLKYARGYMASLGKGATQKNISQTVIKQFPFVLAPILEQRRIVVKIEELFTELEAGVASLQLAQAQLKTYRQALLKHAFEGKLTAQWRAENAGKLEDAQTLLQRIQAERQARYEAEVVAWEDGGENGRKPRPLKDLPPLTPTELADLPELPAGWVWVKVDTLGEVQLGRQRSPKNRSKDFPTKYIRAANITENGLALTDVMDMEFKPDDFQRYQLMYGDILLSEASGSPDQVGKPALWRDQIPNCCFQNTVIRLRLLESLYGEYFLHLFKHFYTNGVFAKTASGVGINHLSAGKFASLSAPLAPVNEQKQIAQEIDLRLSVIDQLEQDITVALQQAEALRQSILKKAFAGQLVPQDPQDEPASALLARIRAAKEEAVKTDQAKKNVNKKPTRRKTKRNGA